MAAQVSWRPWEMGDQVRTAFGIFRCRYAKHYKLVGIASMLAVNKLFDRLAFCLLASWFFIFSFVFIHLKFS